MTAKISANRVLGDITAAGAAASWKIANVVLDKWGLTYAGPDLRGFGNLGDGAGFLYASSSGLVFNGRPANAGVATTQSCRVFEEDADQINQNGGQTDSRTNNRVKVARWSVSEAAVVRASETKPNRICKSDDVIDCSRRDVDERTRRDFDESDYK